MKIRKLFSFILACLMLSMVACNNTAGNNGDDTSADTGSVETEEVKTGYYYNIPEGVRYDDQTFTIMSYNSTKSWSGWFVGDGSQPDTMNQAAYKRNLEIQDLLGVTIDQYLVSGNKKTAPYNLFVQQVLAGETDFDLFVPGGGKLNAVATDNLAYSWNELPVVDLTAPWYNQSANEVFSIAGKQFIASGDLTYTLRGNGALLFNKGLFDKNQLEYPYEAVFNGTWDFDMLLSYCKDYYADLNNDGMEGPEDQYGLVTGSGHIGTYPYSLGHSVVKYDEDGELILNYYSERLADVISDLQSLYTNPDVRMAEEGNEYQIFNEGRALFESYSSDITKLRDVEVDFGYLIYPKYDLSQEEYHCYAGGGVMLVPNVAQDFEFTGTVIEALSAGSNKYLVDAWVTNNIEGKVLRDDESVQVFRMKREAAVYQLTTYFEPSNMIGYGELLKTKTTGLASHYASVETAIRTAFAKFYEQVADN